jgi:hypothetical protein
MGTPDQQEPKTADRENSFNTDNHTAGQFPCLTEFDAIITTLCAKS